MTTVFLVDDHQLFLSGVRAELGDEFEVVGSASEVDAAIELIGERAPDVVLVDVHMPAGGGPRVIREVLASHPDTKFLALSVSDSPDDVIATIRAGARGYVTKSLAPGEHADAIRRVVDGDAVFSPRLAGFVLDAFAGVPVGAVDVFVRDRGRGFDPDAVPGDRYGVRNSIIDRMQRHGGSAEVRSAPGDGTEVRLHLARQPRQEDTHE
jgi:CheY-like chemotaxis protein